MQKSVDKKIDIVVSKFPTVSETFIVNQIVYLIDNGWDVRIFCLGGINYELINLHDNISKYRLVEKCVSLSAKDIIPTSKVQRLLKMISFFLKKQDARVLYSCIKALNVFKFEREVVSLSRFYWMKNLKYFLHEDRVVHVHFATNGNHFFSLFKHIEEKPKGVVSLHGYDVNNSKLSSTVYSYLAEKIDCVYLANSRYTKQNALRFGFDNERVKILPVGLDTDKFSPEQKSPGGCFRVLFVGRFIELKAPLLALEIFHKFSLTEENVELLMVGEGPEYSKCKEYISSNNLKNVKLLGKVSQEKVFSLMQDSSVFLFPGITDSQGRSEAQGLVIQEAQSMGLPVLVSDAGGMKDGVLDGVTGFVTAEANVDGFIEKLKILKNNNQLYSNMSSQARQYVIKNFDNKVLGKKLVDVYNQLL